MRGPASKIPILAVRICPACLRRGAYDASEVFPNGKPRNAPDGWIHVAIYDADDYVCSKGCMEALVQAARARRRSLEHNKVELPPEVEV